MFIEPKYNDLEEFYRDSGKLNDLEPRKECTKEKKSWIKNSSKQEYNEVLQIYFNQYLNLSFFKMRKLGPECDPKNLLLNDYYSWYEEIDGTRVKRLDDTTPKTLVVTLLEKIVKNLLICVTTRRQWRRERIKNLNSKQTINHTSRTVHRNKVEIICTN